MSRSRGWEQEGKGWAGQEASLCRAAQLVSSHNFWQVPALIKETEQL